MPFKFGLEIHGAKELKKRFRVDIPAAMDETIYRGVVLSTLLVEGDAKKYLTGQSMDSAQEKAFQLTGNTYLASSSLRRITANFSNTITHKILQLPPSRVEGSVGTNAVQARIHEVGGVIKAKYSPFLIFKTDDGLWRRVKEVTMPARPYLLPAIIKNEKNIYKLFESAFYKSLKTRGIN